LQRLPKSSVAATSILSKQGGPKPIFFAVALDSWPIRLKGASGDRTCSFNE
jgi:hypothetical protein